MKVFLAAVLFVGLCVLGLGVNIFFRKGGKFPEHDISSNPEMRKRGIKCPKEEEMERLTGGKRAAACTGQFSDACRGCAFYKFEK
ncbi:MAG: hypothetical protein J6T02_04570 [Bacteroidales bacterium]|nr:hypothetical protein [Bacteroidales bacterium]